jgi:hypothetical protein
MVIWIGGFGVALGYVMPLTLGMTQIRLTSDMQRAIIEVMTPIPPIL